MEDRLMENLIQGDEIYILFFKFSELSGCVSLRIVYLNF